jgi:uncharacterized Zn finger protein
MADKRWYREFPFPPKSTPREAKGGIKAQSKQGGFGKSWWARRWISVLESFNLGTRLARGRSYARRGQVVSIDISIGVVRASVQGSRPAPYKVTIEVKTLSEEDGNRLGHALGSQALFAAKLLANQMPQDIETAFRAANLALFPQTADDLKTECSCPDWSNPCKHVAAVYYLLGEEFDRDPFLIFKLRGLDREKLIGVIGVEDRAANQEHQQSECPDSSAEGISTEAARFWQGADLSTEMSLDVQTPPVTAPLLRRLGSFPFWRSERRFIEAFEPIYARASREALTVFEDKSSATDSSLQSTKRRG